MRRSIVYLAALILLVGLLRELGLFARSPGEVDIEHELSEEEEEEWAAPLEVPPPPDRAAAPAPLDLQELLKTAEEFAKAGDYYGELDLLTTALGERPNEPEHCYLLARVYYNLNLIRDAVEFIPCLEGASRALYPRVRVLLDKLHRGEEYEFDFASAVSDHFMASFPVRGRSAEAIGQVLDLLEQARRSIEAKWGLAAPRPVPVVVYDDYFGRATGTADELRGLYDGKIRIPVEDLEERPERFQQTLAHEYVHAVLRQRVCSRIPAWLNEGLAVYLSGETYEFEDLRDQLDVADQLLDLPTLSRSFRDLPAARVKLAYFQSYWMTRGLIDESGWGRVHALLRDLERDPRARFEQRFAFHFGETPQAYLERWYDEVL